MIAYALALAGLVGFAQGLAFLRAEKTRLIGTGLAPLGILAFGLGVLGVLVPGFL